MPAVYSSIVLLIVLGLVQVAGFALAIKGNSSVWLPSANHRRHMRQGVSGELGTGTDSVWACYWRGAQIGGSAAAAMADPTRRYSQGLE